MINRWEPNGASSFSEPLATSRVKTQERFGALNSLSAELVFRANDSWAIVDFKTDAEIESRLDEYRARLRSVRKDSRRGSFVGL